MTEKNNITLNKEIMSSDSQESNILSSAQIGRSQFELLMFEKGLISEDFYESGALDLFELNAKTGYDALKHILIGSNRGGLHHLPTNIEIGNVDTKISSSIGSFKLTSKPLSKHRSSQKIKDNGVYRAGDIVIETDDGNRHIKKAGSNMFPNDWTTQQVLESILLVAKEPGQLVGQEINNPRIIHRGNINDVNIEVITSPDTGNVITAFPIRD
jgi:Bacterial EndoU nuclease